MTLATILISAMQLVFGTPGVHVLTANVSDADTAIRITSNDVTLDLAGYMVFCAPTNPFTAASTGIDLQGRHGVTIRNGIVTACHTGIQGTLASNVTIVDVDVSRNTYIGVQLADGSNNRVQRLRCRNIGGYTPEAYAICVNGVGDDGIVEESEFGELYRQPGATTVGEAVAVLVREGETNVRVRDNAIDNARLQPGSIAVWYGLNATGSVTGNAINNFDFPVAAYGSIEQSDNVITHEVASVGQQVEVTTLTVAPGQPIAFTVTNIDPPWPMDWVALTLAAGADNTYVDWWYLNGSKTAPATGVLTAALQFTAPTTVGTYNIRLFANNSLAVKLATSATITVSNAPPSGETKWFRVCTEPGVCYEGTLTRVQP